MCETNPICLGVQEGRSRGEKSAKRTQFGPAWAEPGPDERKMQNEPNSAQPPGRSGPLGAKDAKRSQFPSAARGVLKGTSRITPHGVTTNPGLTVSNKANSGVRPGPGGRSCETNPISEEVSSLKCQVLSQVSRMSSPGGLPTSDFTLGFPNAEFRVWGPLQTSGGTPTGQSQACETKPI